MNRRFYRIIKERGSFRRTDLTKLGHLDAQIEQVHAFRDGDMRYLRIAFNTPPSSELIAALDKKVFGMGEMEVIDSAYNDELEALYVSCLPREGSKNYLLYFDRPTYTRIES